MDRQLVELSTGISLEAEVTAPSEPQGKLAVCLHPWSRLGGCMDDPVLHRVAQALIEKGYHVLRFNSRGNGQSTGWPSFSGLLEGKDLQALIEWVMQNVVHNVETLVIMGYSHGSLIASLQPLLIPNTSHILLSYPLSVRGFLTLFHTKTYSQQLRDLVQTPGTNVLILYGDKDEFTGESTYDTWTSELRKDVNEESTLSVVKFPGASHFWIGQAGKDMARTVQDWVS